MNYNQLNITVDNREFEVSFSTDDMCKIHISGKEYIVEELKKLGDGVFSFSVNSRLYQVELENNGKDLTIIKDGLEYTIKITDSTAKLLNQFIKQNSDTAVAEGIIKAPMPGSIVKHFFHEGDTIAEGDKIVVVEAMKMENVLKSPIGGILKKIYAKEGTAVEKNALILEIESITQE